MTKSPIAHGQDMMDRVNPELGRRLRAKARGLETVLGRLTALLPPAPAQEERADG